MNSILTIFVCALVSVVVCAPDKTFFEIKEQCKKETGATKEMILDALRGKVITDPEVTKYFVCSNTRFGVVDAEGHLHKDLHKIKLMTWCDKESKIDSAVEKCTVEKATIEETVVELAKCSYAELHRNVDEV